MLLSILGGLAGVFTSWVPKIFELIGDYFDHKREMDMMTKQAEINKQMHGFKLEQLNVSADIADMKTVRKHDASSGDETGFIGGLRKSVRPVIAYWFMALYTFVKVLTGIALYNATGEFDPLIMRDVWLPTDSAIFFSIIGFYFGNRQLEKFEARKLNPVAN